MQTPVLMLSISPFGCLVVIGVINENKRGRILDTGIVAMNQLPPRSTFNNTSQIVKASMLHWLLSTEC